VTAIANNLHVGDLVRVVEWALWRPDESCYDGDDDREALVSVVAFCADTMVVVLAEDGGLWNVYASGYTVCVLS
jgi:hypothetical protein